MTAPLSSNISPPALQILNLDMNVNVTRRLADLCAWTEAWQLEDGRLKQQVELLDPNRRADVLRGSQLASLRRQLALKITQQPVYLDPDTVRQAGFASLRQHLASQYAHLDTDDRLVWLTNLYFLLTPTLRALIEKLDTIRRYRSMGQQRCFLVGGVSGAGKSSLLNWYAVNYLPVVQAKRNYVPVIKIDAPVSNRSPKPLFQRMLLACGAATLRGDEEHYLQLLELYFQQCGVELLIVDEVEHITQPGLRRRFLELSNLTGVPIVCASCNPIAWAVGDAEVQGRWNDYFELTQFTGPRLDAFLTMLDLLLPFEQDGHLGLREITDEASRKTVDGPAHYIEQWTDGILREVMVLLMDACFKAISTRQPRLTLDILNQAWRDIKRAKVVNFLDILRAGMESPMSEDWFFEFLPLRPGPYAGECLSGYLLRLADLNGCTILWDLVGDLFPTWDAPQQIDKLKWEYPLKDWGRIPLRTGLTPGELTRLTVTPWVEKFRLPPDLHRSIYMSPGHFLKNLVNPVLRVCPLCSAVPTLSATALAVIACDCLPRTWLFASREMFSLWRYTDTE